MDSVVELIEKEFNDVPEVREIAIYMVQRYTILIQVNAALNANLTTVPGVMPEQVQLVMGYDTALVNNSFYIQHYSQIQMLMMQDVLTTHSMDRHLKLSKEHTLSSQVVRDLYTQRFKGLSGLVLLSKGFEEAKRFDFLLSEAVTLTEKEREFFKREGV